MKSFEVCLYSTSVASLSASETVHHVPQRCPQSQPQGHKIYKFATHAILTVVPDAGRRQRQRLGFFCLQVSARTEEICGRQKNKIENKEQLASTNCWISRPSNLLTTPSASRFLGWHHRIHDQRIAGSNHGLTWHASQHKANLQDLQDSWPGIVSSWTWGQSPGHRL